MPHDVQEYILANADRYPGYLLSGDDHSLQKVTMNQAKHCFHETIDQYGEWVPPSAYASLHEQSMKRGIKRVSSTSSTGYYDTTVRQHQVSGLATPLTSSVFATGHISRDVSSSPRYTHAVQGHSHPPLVMPHPKKIVLLVNEGTASAAELFASALHDNGRLVALVGTKTYGKGLIQHTFPLPDGGGLRLTVAEYLTPTLHHVTTVGNARFDPITGDFVGGGIRPDLYCESHHGIPGSNVGADLCVGMALDVLEESEYDPGMQWIE